MMQGSPGCVRAVASSPSQSVAAVIIAVMAYLPGHRVPG